MVDCFDRIVLMANQIDRLGGVGRFVDRMAIEFFERGYEVEMLGVNPAPKHEQVKTLRPEGITTDCLWAGEAPENWTLKTRRHRMNPMRRYRHQKRSRLRKEGTERLRIKLKEWGPRTLIICTQVFAMEHLREAGYDATVSEMPRVVGQYHGSYQMCVQTRDLGRVKRAFAEVERFVCLTESDAQEFRRAGLNNASWIPNPVAPPTNVAREENRENVFVALGRYDRQKSLEYIIRAWNMIHHQLPDWRVELYGEGPLESLLQGLIDAESLPRIKLMGKTDLVETVLASSKIHLLTSQYEGLPISIVEASLSGVPTIAFDCAPGIGDLVIDARTGYIVPQNNVKLLAQRMQALAVDDETRHQFSLEGRNYASRYTPSHIIDRWEDLLRDLRE